MKNITDAVCSFLADINSSLTSDSYNLTFHFCSSEKIINVRVYTWFIPTGVFMLTRVVNSNKKRTKKKLSIVNHKTREINWHFPTNETFGKKTVVKINKKNLIIHIALQPMLSMLTTQTRTNSIEKRSTIKRYAMKIII
jgi:hypothetical protein